MIALLFLILSYLCNVYDNENIKYSYYRANYAIIQQFNNSIMLPPPPPSIPCLFRPLPALSPRPSVHLLRLPVHPSVRFSVRLSARPFLRPPTRTSVRPSQIGFTALMYATQRGHLEMATLLADNGADIEAKNNVSVAVSGTSNDSISVSISMWCLKRYFS